MNIDKALDAQDTRGYNHVRWMSPDEQSERAARRRELIDEIVDALRNQAEMPDSSLAEEFSSSVHRIICDSGDDKLGRISDLHDKCLEDFAIYLADNIDQPYVMGVLLDLDVNFEGNSL